MLYSSTSNEQSVEWYVLITNGGLPPVPVHRTVADTLGRPSVVVVVVVGCDPLHFLSLWLQYGNQRCAPTDSYKSAISIPLHFASTTGLHAVPARTRANASGQFLIYVSGQYARADKSHAPKSQIDNNASERPTWPCNAGGNAVRAYFEEKKCLWFAA